MVQSIFSLLYERRDWFLSLLGEHIAISAVAITIAMFIGLWLGIWVSENPKIAPVVMGATNAVYTIPSIALLGILIPWFGIGNKTAVIALTIYALLPMVRNTCAGINSIDKGVIEAAKGMGSTRSQVLFRIKLPLAMSIIVAGIRNMVVMTLAVASIASFIGAGGLGVAIYRGITSNNAAMTYAGSLIIALLALTCDLLLGKVEKHLKKTRRIN